MAKFLSIIIPSYRETEAQIYPLLASICTQAGVNLSEVETLIVNDGGGNIYSDDFLRMFPLDIREFALPINRGPGLAREAGIYKARGEYVMFCDADDSLHNTGALQALIMAAKSQGPDMIRSEWIEEAVDRNTGSLVYLRHQGDNTWMHGKAIRRQFLLDHNIHFHPELRVHEDSYFLSIAAAHTSRYVSIDSITYLWRFNPNSITRSNSWDYEFSRFPDFFRAVGMAHEEINKFNPAQMPYKIVQSACYCYFVMHEPKWLDERAANWRAATESSYVKSVAGLWRYFLDADPNFVRLVYNEERAKHGADQIERETLALWLTRIGLDVPDWMK